MIIGVRNECVAVIQIDIYRYIMQFDIDNWDEMIYFQLVKMSSKKLNP